jgi:hypothetical protein
MIKKITSDLISNFLYSAVVVVLLTWFTYENYEGSKFIPDKNVQKNAGYNGPVPHSGYGVRFYHK